jgi:hypothetical protein
MSTHADGVPTVQLPQAEKSHVDLSVQEGESTVAFG